ncbi:flavodoxin/nitric oxide synthase [Methanothermus fervidus DSM 2088]|uniref:Flavodoxin/nitric oxide synthase n=1 Tax=Methanothermus fervidus (strain ATCC 43054 / DSM 2088 / JCM 10308 / V24 S) TaxID=523846 RepID=E3GWJ1_METFV|nr:flavodoxin [Methanothermus fervidus]ADP77956.1 flavodoxin/nitric oxide synthase [Methanothermus fervidus DSM 2088]
MKINPIVIYYSRTGNTEVVAKTIAKETKAELVKIEDLKNRRGFFGIFLAIVDALLKKKTDITPRSIDLKKYDVIYIGSPVWARNPAPAILTFIDNSDFSNKNVVIFVTMAAHGGDNAIKTMKEKIYSKNGKVIGAFSIKTRDKNKEEIKEETIKKLGEINV